MNANCNRRGFLKAAAVGATAVSISAHSYGRVVGANDRIRLAQIGCGDRGTNAHMMGVHKHRQGPERRVRGRGRPVAFGS